VLPSLGAQLRVKDAAGALLGRAAMLAISG
jgi:hypothetical protein